MQRFAPRLFLGAGLLAGLMSGAHAFELKSADIRDNETLKTAQVFKGCGGDNLSPQLTWSNAPDGTKSFAVTIYDPDAPTGSGWWHWLAYDIPATTQQLDTGAGGADKLPAGAKHGRNDYGTKDFGGACPPRGDKPHRYVVTVYALKVPQLNVPADASAAMIGFNLNANKLGSATITGLYGR
ncbi:MAG TPA: YbhB/YbcL family Raf kinase inhibitor-like protein [Paucimonas sp.]|nr:YbhB/YbcL family Raf kinase inhibitor-like protein [Paucimonas sp.]